MNQRRLEVAPALHDFIFVYGPSPGSTQMAYVGTSDSGSSVRIDMAASPTLPPSLCYYLQAYKVCSEILL